MVAVGGDRVVLRNGRVFIHGRYFGTIPATRTPRPRLRCILEAFGQASVDASLMLSLPRNQA